MPAPGEQHNIIANPFEEPRPRVSEFTAQEIATLQSRLEKQLGPEYLSSRSGPSGQKVHYIAAEKCIALANEVFGFNGWSSGIQNIQVDFVDENPQTMRVSLGLSVIVRVSLRDGTFHEDIGYGHIENCKGKAAAFEKAKKEGTTDALKRALRNFGNVLGNCIYDKDYLKQVTKIKVAPSKFDEGGLHRHADYAKKEPEVKAEVKTEADVTMGEFEDLLGEFDEADFCVAEEEHPDEVTLPNSVQPLSKEQMLGRPAANGQRMQPPSRPLGRSTSAGNTVPRQPQTPNQAQGQRPGPPMNHNQNNQNGPRPQQQPHQPQHNHAQTINAQAQNEFPAFFSARAVDKLPEDSNQLVVPSQAQIFNPRAESPSIRKTPGIDHSKSKPLARNGQHVPPTTSTTDKDRSSQGAETSGAGPPAPAPAAAAAAAAATTNGRGSPANGPGRPAVQVGPRGHVLNPQLDQSRRIGAPGAMGMGSPLGNRGSAFRPPSNVKRPLPAESAAAGRGALTEVSANQPVGASVNGVDAKRVKMS